MSTTEAPRTAFPRSPVAATVRKALDTIVGGRLARMPIALSFWDGSRIEPDSPIATVSVRHPVAVAHVLREPNQIGLARAYVSGAIDADDPEAVLALRHELGSLSLSAADRARFVLTALATAGNRALRKPPVPEIEALPARRVHTLTRDRRSISHHYDVSNAFYERLLGPSMVYSCAVWQDGDTLEDAQARKLDLLCRKLRLQSGDRLLDIGCGWGSLLIHAASTYGVEGVGITLSEAQATLARERIEAAGLGERVEIRVSDYREIADGPFDKIVSVGMYEHIGRDQLGVYAGAVHRLLRPGGLFLNHGIARLHSPAPRSDTFISRYIFPDGELHPLADLETALREHAFEVRHVESIREHYPPTLRSWIANLDAHEDELIAEVGRERVRAWRLYLLGSALSFEDRDTTVFQVLSCA